jgi:hypothetical protein
MSKIAAEHFARTAFVYIRQSTADQLVHNQESRRRQYGLAEECQEFLVGTIDLALIWEIPSSRMSASVPSDPHRSPNSVDCHIDRGPLRGLLNHSSQALMACNESGPGT